MNEFLGSITNQIRTKLISREAIKWLSRRLSRGLLLFISVVLICCLHTYRIASNDEFFVYTSRKCMFLKSRWLNTIDNENFFYSMWEAIPSIVNICSYGQLSDRIDTYEKDGHEVRFLTNNIEDPGHHCDIIFVTDDGDLTIPLEMKRKYNDCKIQSSSDKHHGVPSNPLLGITTYPFKVQPLGGLKEDLFEDIDPSDFKNVSLVSLMSFFVRKFRASSIVINTKDAAKFVPLFFSKGKFEESHLITCQLNIVYPKPKTYHEMVEFRIAWLRLLNDRNYWLRHVSRTKDTLNMFLLSISDGFCWQKYLTWTLPHLVKY